MLNSKNSNFHNVLFSNNKIINHKDNPEKNISEELLTIRTLVLCRPFEQRPEEMEQLEKILIACKLQKDAYKVVENVNSWAFYRQCNNIKEILLFGLTEKDLNLDVHFNENQINRFDERVFIKTTSLADLLRSQHIKNDLWQNALKVHFLS